MSDGMTVEEFRELAAVKLGWLIDRGFDRVKNFEQVTPTTGTLVYCGKHVAFEFSLDARDQCVDAEVIKVENGSLCRNWDGGYSKDIFAHLVAVEGYRGSPTGTIKTPVSSSKISQAIAEWSSLLENAGSNLLADRPDSLE